MTFYRFKCPICGMKKIWLHEATSHLNKRHPGVSLYELKKLLIEGIKSRSIGIEVIEGPDPGLRSATHVLSDKARLTRAGIRAVVSGGKLK